MASTLRLVSDDERRARLGRRHALAGAQNPDSVGQVDRAESVADAVAALVCLHATEPANVYLSTHARGDFSFADVDRALYADRSVVKQRGMRRTVFAFPRELLPAVWGSAAARVSGPLRTRLAKEVTDNGIAADGEVWLKDTFAAILGHLEEHGPTTTGGLRARIPGMDQTLLMAPGKDYGGNFPIASRVLTVLAADGAVLRGDNNGGWKLSRPFWTRAADWLDPLPEPLDEAAGYAELVGRWLLRFGPGTEADLVWWLGATKSAVRRALEQVGAVPVALESGPEPGWLHPDDTDRVEEPEPWAALLPPLDPTTMGWQGRGFYLGQYADRLVDRGNAGSTAWWGGRVVGSWVQEPSGRVRLLLLEDLGPRASAALEERAERLTKWLDGEVVNSIYPAPVVREAMRSL